MFDETIMHPHRALKRKFQNSLWFLCPTQLPTHGQWWSILITHALHILQWWARGGLNETHFSQYRHIIKLWESSWNCSSTEFSIYNHEFSFISQISSPVIYLPICLNSTSLVLSSYCIRVLASSSTLCTLEKSYNFSRVNIFILCTRKAFKG